MPLLLECAEFVGPIPHTDGIYDALIKAIGTEPDSDVLSEIMHSFAKVSIFLSKISVNSLCVHIFVLIDGGIFFYAVTLICNQKYLIFFGVITFSLFFKSRVVSYSGLD